ncbi:MAG: Gfo/Idh/MocA family oxidoreductase, partial [Lentisphaeria bacterium]|nr:Gfo/Idh/MocA family oxidoreductase [Lentisphaeria bacterium]
MEKKPIKFGIVGLGRGKGLIVDSLRDPDVQLTAICDRNPEKLQAAQEYFAKEQVTDLILCDNYDDLLKTDIDAVIIATDAVCHVPYAVQALEAGKHVLSEIPAVNSLEEAKLLKKAVSAHPELKYMTAENGCYLGFIQAWKKMYADGKFGDIVYAEAEYLHAPDPATIRPEKYARDHWRNWNPAVKYCTHELGPLLYIMDDHCVSVSCMVPDVVYNPY